MKRLSHPMVATSDGGGYCPVQYEGQLVDGRHFYFRYRGGWAALGFGATADDAVRDTMGDGSGASVSHGDALQGFFEDDADRDAVFAELLARKLAQDPAKARELLHRALLRRAAERNRAALDRLAEEGTQ